MVKKNMEMGEEESSRKTKPKIPPMVDIYFHVCDDKEDRWYTIPKSSSSSSSSWEDKFLQPSLPPLPEPIKRPKFASIGSKIYASGGFSRGLGTQGPMKFPIIHPSNKVFYIDTRHPIEGWKAAAPMNTKRMSHYMLADAGKIYVLGGYMLPKSADGKHLFAEVYDPKSNTWEQLAHAGDDIDLPQPIYGHAVVDHGRKILFHAYFCQSLFYLNTTQKDAVGVYDETFGQYRPSSVFLDGVLYFFSRKDIFAYEVSSSSHEDKHVVLRNVKMNTLPHRDLSEESMPSGRLLSLGNGHLALIWAKTPEFETFLKVHCSILEMSKKEDSFVCTVLKCSTHTVQSGTLGFCLAVWKRLCQHDFEIILNLEKFIWNKRLKPVIYTLVKRLKPVTSKS